MDFEYGLIMINTPTCPPGSGVVESTPPLGGPVQSRYWRNANIQVARQARLSPKKPPHHHVARRVHILGKKSAGLIDKYTSMTGSNAVPASRGARRVKPARIFPLRVLDPESDLGEVITLGSTVCRKVPPAAFPRRCEISER